MTISFLILIFVTSFLVENNIAKIVLFILAFVLLIIGVSFALKIETQKCHHKYVPKYSQVYFAMHSGLHDIWNVQNVTRKVGKERL